ncbi:hypothetical protein IEQ34_018760 [Dendrobium chrysotoxum]|uniref:Uncharacterized protein n=1 Tax=Dendrobium chrysotoxum TaxID=161865 RepID=A0AAV7G5J1_DENCH|nr:hypothetical protein IEQ34_018760 [Dendrobium chrysotoxum]
MMGRINAPHLQLAPPTNRSRSQVAICFRIRRTWRKESKEIKRSEKNNERVTLMQILKNLISIDTIEDFGTVRYPAILQIDFTKKI